MTEPSSHADVKKFYDEQRYGAASDSSKSLPWHTRKIAARLGSMSGKRVLDIACGTGEWLAELQRHGAEVAGIDISENAIATCRLRFPGADFRCGVAESLPFADAAFELVTCLGSLEHFLDQPGALAEMHRVCKPGGRVLILVPNAGFLTRRLGLYKGTEQTQIRETVYEISTWEAMFRAAGLSVRARWRDLHNLNPQWINRGNPLLRIARLVQALTLGVWPVAWQYQVYFLLDRAGER